MATTQICYQILQVSYDSLEASSMKGWVLLKWLPRCQGLIVSWPWQRMTLYLSMAFFDSDSLTHMLSWTYIHNGLSITQVTLWIPWLHSFMAQTAITLLLLSLRANNSTSAIISPESMSHWSHELKIAPVLSLALTLCSIDTEDSIAPFM